MAHADLREFMAALEAEGELARVEPEVDWNLEAGAVIRRTYEKGGPAIHFRKIKGCPDGYSLLGAPLGRGRRGIWSKLAIALQLDPQTPYKNIREEFIRRINSPVKPYQVASGPCKQNIIRGKDVDLFQFPALYFHDGDGGRYIGTWASTVTRDADSDWVNWGVYRQMIATRNRLTGMVLPSSHLAKMYYEKYEDRNIPMPFAIAIGTDPLVTIASAIPAPAGVNEAVLAGGLRREPLQLVKCETNDLLVPATSEIIIEGVMVPGDRLEEGPFGELSGYRTMPRAPRPTYRVQCITHRDDPILPASGAGAPIDEEQIVTCLAMDVELLQAFRRRGWPVADCFAPPWLAGHYVVITTKMPYSGFRDQIMSVVRATTAGKTLPFIQICDDDIDPTNLDLVFHGLVTKCHPRRDTQIIDEAPGTPWIPFLEANERRFVEKTGRKYASSSTILLDATWPLDWDPSIAIPPRASFDSIYPKEIQEKVLANWFDVYGFPRDEHQVINREKAVVS